MSLLPIQGNLEVHRSSLKIVIQLFNFVPPVCLTFLAQGIANEDRFEEDEHKEIRVKARGAESWSRQLRDSEVWHNVKAKTL